MAEPANPFAPGRSEEEAPPEAPHRRPARWLAVLAALLCFQPLPGVGLHVLGRPRRFLMWSAPAIVAETVMYAAAWYGRPWLFLVALLAIFALGTGSLIDTFVASSSSAAPRFGRALITVLAIFLCGRAAQYGVKQWLVESFAIPSGAMVPTLVVGDRIMVRKQTGDIRRGDLAVFRYPPNPSVSYIKRVIAIGGDTVLVHANNVYVNGKALPQTSSDEACPQPADAQPAGTCRLLHEQSDGRAHDIMVAGEYGADSPTVAVPPGSVFVLGDNRNNSMDSRMWGVLPSRHLLGTPTFIYFSVGAEGARWERVGREVR